MPISVTDYCLQVGNESKIENVTLHSVSSHVSKHPLAVSSSVSYLHCIAIL